MNDEPGSFKIGAKNLCIQWSRGSPILPIDSKLQLQMGKQTKIILSSYLIISHFGYFLPAHKAGFSCLANPQWRACGHWVVFTSLCLKIFLSSPLRPPASALARSDFTMLSVNVGGGVIKSSSINSDPWFGKGPCLSLGSLFSCCLLWCSSSWQPLFLTMTLLCLTWMDIC